MLTRPQIIELCTIWGHGIVSENDSNSVTCPAEVERAIHENDRVRYVSNSLVDYYFENARLDQLEECYKSIHDKTRLWLDYCDWQDWQWIQDACGITLPYAIANKIEVILFGIIDGRVIEIDIDDQLRERWLDEFKTTNNLDETSAVSYLFMPKEGIDSENAHKIAAVFREYGIDIQHLVCAKLRTSFPKRPVTISSASD